MRIYLRHMLPNIAGPLIVQFTVNFPEIILLESALSFLGLGIQPPATSLGLMVADGRNYLATAWWLAAFPGAVIVLTTLSISLLCDYLRDRLDAPGRLAGSGSLTQSTEPSISFEAATTGRSRSVSSKNAARRSGELRISFRFCGSATLSFILVALGETNGYVSLCDSTWDVTAALPILAILGVSHAIGWDEFVSRLQPLLLNVAAAA
jgi:hypothetical protein